MNKYFHIVHKTSIESNLSFEYFLDRLEVFIETYIDIDKANNPIVFYKAVKDLFNKYFVYDKEKEYIHEIYYTELGNALLCKLDMDSSLVKDIILYLYQRMIDEKYELD